MEGIMKFQTGSYIGALLLGSAASALMPAAAQQDQPAVEDEEDVIVVTGSQIEGSKITDTLPVTVLTVDDIDAVGPSSGDELFRSIPQAGDVNFFEGRTAGGVNDARGDIASINLRSLGTGNTLLLLNGRRMVLHPGYQTENLVPVTTPNVNAIPTNGVRRVEVLRDGAAAIYGTDAVGGVVNTILRDNYDGFNMEVQYGGSEGTSLRELELSMGYGRDFNQGRSNIALFVDFLGREGMPASDRDYARSYDLRPQVAGTQFEGDTDFDNRSTNSPFGEFQTYDYTATIRQDGTALTSPGDFWHIQPDTIAGCLADLGQGLCIDNSTQNGNSEEDRLYRYNFNHDRWIFGDTDRYNAFAFLNHDFGNGIEFFGEAGIYYSDYSSFREQASPLSAIDIIVPANNYYNPFGPVTFSDGSVNPNRLPGLNIPDEGVANVLNDYRFVDAGRRNIQVENMSYRLLGGLRGDWSGWGWETAALWSEAETEDRTNRISMTLLQDALALETPAAYNPFNGGNLNDFPNGDTTVSDQSTIDSFMVDVSRTNSTELGLVDFKMSRPDFFPTWAGDVGAAFGAEYRYEAFDDDRDPRLDGTLTFVNPISGDTFGSDVLGSSPTPDSSGDRNVYSAFGELAVPLVNPEMGIPLMRELNMQLAVRYENYSDVGDVLKPKVALGWDVTSFFKLRGTYSEGFRAPNLPQINERGVERSNGRLDYIQCEAEIRNGTIATLDDCTQSQSVVSERQGSNDLEPEDNTTYTYGFVLQPDWWDPKFGAFTLTVDYWNIEQENVVGIFGDDNHLALDYLLRVTEGTTNPAVFRDTPDQDTIDRFAGTGLEPAGEVLRVEDNYLNLLPRQIEGVDITAVYDLDDTPLGDFRFSLAGAHLIDFVQEPSPEAAAIIAAQEAGTISDGFVVDGANSLLRINGNPEWRVSSTLTWRSGTGWGAGLYGKYTSPVDDTSATLSDGTIFEVDEWYYGNVYVQYDFETAGLLEDTRIRVGARNFTNEDPPLADSTNGYLGELHSARGRFIYAAIRKRF
jgi:outer membrane receptor protein involved in Fe transport